VQPDLPAAVAELDDEQRAYLAALAAGAVTARPANGEAWQNLIFAVATERRLAAGRAFAALYAAFLGRSNGPRAGWLLASLDERFVLARLRDAAGEPAETPA
jgi:lysyl-tRNA synthetase class 1